MLKIIAICLTFASTVLNGAGLDLQSHAEQMRREIESGELGPRTVEALESMLSVGAAALRAEAVELRDDGLDEDADLYDREAETILSDWHYRVKPFVLDPAKEMGDYEPVQWLYNVWQKLDALLGRQLCISLHLDDIWIVSMSLPQVIRCANNPTEEDYFSHFVGGPVTDVKLFEGGFAGSITYWVSQISCSFGVPFPYSAFCGSIAMLAEVVMEDWIAPRLNPRVWRMACEARPT